VRAPEIGDVEREAFYRHGRSTRSTRLCSLGGSLSRGGGCRGQRRNERRKRINRAADDGIGQDELEAFSDGGGEFCPLGRRGERITNPQDLSGIGFYSLELEVYT
jgi:hypothetical protein